MILLYNISDRLSMFLENFSKFLRYFGKGRYLKLTGFGFLSFIAGCLEFLGVALIYPFIILIIKPDSFSNLPYFNFENTIDNGLLIGLVVLLIFVFKNLYIIFLQYIQNKFVSNWKRDIVYKFMDYYIYAPYKNVMQTSQADKLYVLETLCPQVVDNFVMRILNLITNIVIVGMIIFLLLIKFLVPALVTIVFVTTAMIIQNKFFKNRSALVGDLLARKTKQYRTSTIESITNIKELKILSAEKIFSDNFLQISDELKRIQTKYGFYLAIPPYFVEILVVVSLLVMAYILSLQNLNDNSSLVASFAIVVAALFRIAPSLNRIQASVININSSRDFVKKLINTYEKCDLNNFSHASEGSQQPISFRDKIVLKNINFSYTPDKPVLKQVSFEINKGDFIGIIGLSGAGKSTLADVLTGLLPVDSGEIIVDNTVLNRNNFSQFRKLIGYIPQQINLMDRSFKDNITWGCVHVDEAGVIKALKAARLYDTVCEYDNGIDSNVIIGSNGLSQGQKQRLAIARALYRDPEILIFDEATSALDVKVESEITEMLNQIGNTKTIIAIAHRLSTLKACNKLVYMKNGKVVDIGSFDELTERYSEFADLVQLSKIN